MKALVVFCSLITLTSCDFDPDTQVQTPDPMVHRVEVVPGPNACAIVGDSHELKCWGKTDFSPLHAALKGQWVHEVYLEPSVNVQGLYWLCVIVGPTRQVRCWNGAPGIIEELNRIRSSGSDWSRVHRLSLSNDHFCLIKGDLREVVCGVFWENLLLSHEYRKTLGEHVHQLEMTDGGEPCVILGPARRLHCPHPLQGTSVNSSWFQVFSGGGSAWGMPLSDGKPIPLNGAGAFALQALSVKENILNKLERPIQYMYLKRQFTTCFKFENESDLDCCQQHPSVDSDKVEQFKIRGPVSLISAIGYPWIKGDDIGCVLRPPNIRLECWGNGLRDIPSDIGTMIDPPFEKQWITF